MIIAHLESYITYAEKRVMMIIESFTNMFFYK